MQHSKNPRGTLQPPVQAWTSNPLVGQRNAYNNTNTDTELSAVQQTQGKQSAAQMIKQISMEQEVDKYMHSAECATSVTERLTDIIQPILEDAISRRLAPFVTIQDNLVETVTRVVKKVDNLEDSLAYLV